MKTKDTVKNLDKYLRDKSGMTSDEFISKYCEIFRDHACVTPDGSLNEFEKLITHVLGMYIYQKRRAEILGLDLDPRKFVWDYENSSENPQ